MHPIERIINTFEGKPVDRVPTFCAMVEDRTFNEVLGSPLIPQEKLMNNPVSRFFLDRWGGEAVENRVSDRDDPGAGKTHQGTG